MQMHRYLMQMHRYLMQMHSKCSANAFVIFHIIANASKYNANESVVYANALLLHEIKEIYIYNIPIYFISFHI